MTIQEQILEYLLEGNGRCTHEIAKKFNLTNRQVGAIMGHLSRLGKVQTYTKGTIWITKGINESGSKSSPMRLSNSFYEAI